MLTTLLSASLRAGTAALLGAGLWLSPANAAASATPGEDSPPIPIGTDAYRDWQHWPVLRQGVRAYMRSTYDRGGLNERADAAHFLYQLAEDRNVTLDVTGHGVLYFARYNHWHGSPWTYEVDGRSHLVAESTTADPTRPVRGSVFLPERAFPKPLAWTWADTKGADLSWVPIGFEHSFRMMYGRTFYGTGYYIYHLIDPAAPLTRAIQAWEGQSAPDSEALAVIGRAGSDLLPAMTSGEGRALGLKEISGRLDLPVETAVRLTELVVTETHAVRALMLSVPRAEALALGRARLRITWDDERAPSVDAPVALFFGAGTLYNRDGREFLVKAFPVNIRFDAERVQLACYFPMPFGRRARIELAGAGGQPVAGVRWSLRYAPSQVPLRWQGLFHATHRDFPSPEPGRDLVLLDTREVEGGGDWSGHFVGTSFIFSRRNVLNTLEGDPRFFFDDSQTPQAYGTGTEEWAGGGDYWGGENMTLPFAGHPVGAPRVELARDEEDKIQSGYRFLLADLMPFGRNAVIRLEHGGENDSTEHYETVTYWYGRRGATLVPTDRLDLASDESEESHGYVSPTASARYPITSRYEGGPDHLHGRELYPAHTEVGRAMTGTSEFTLRVAPGNQGVLLRRTLDYQFPNQRAEVSVATEVDGRFGEFRAAGIWHLAGSNTCLFSNVIEELAPSQHIVQMSNRRFRDDEFLISRRLTAGADRIRVRVTFTPVRTPLLPGEGLRELAWSEIRYDAYSLVPPR